MKSKYKFFRKIDLIKINMTQDLEKIVILKGKDWKIEIFPTGSECCYFPYADDKRIYECLKEMNEAKKEQEKK